MIKLTFCLTRLPHLSREAFQAYWFNTHGPLVASVAETLRIRRYVQAHTLTTPLDAALRESRGGSVEPFDGVAELWWESIEDLAEAMATPAGAQAARALLEDEGRFIDLDASPIWIADEHVVVG